MKDKIVAVLTNNPILSIKYFRIKTVPINKKRIQNQYPYFSSLLKSSFVVLFIALGEASKVVIVVLNIVVKAAIAIKI